MSARIHPSAIVDPDARLGADVEIGAFAIIVAGLCNRREDRIPKKGRNGKT